MFSSDWRSEDQIVPWGHPSRPHLPTSAVTSLHWWCPMEGTTHAMELFLSWRTIAHTQLVQPWPPLLWKVSLHLLHWLLFVNVLKLIFSIVPFAPVPKIYPVAELTYAGSRLLLNCTCTVVDALPNQTMVDMLWYKDSNLLLNNTYLLVGPHNPCVSHLLCKEVVVHSCNGTGTVECICAMWPLDQWFPPCMCTARYSLPPTGFQL